MDVQLFMSYVAHFVPEIKKKLISDKIYAKTIFFFETFLFQFSSLLLFGCCFFLLALILYVLEFIGSSLTEWLQNNYMNEKEKKETENLFTNKRFAWGKLSCPVVLFCFFNSFSVFGCFNFESVPNLTSHLSFCVWWHK